MSRRHTQARVISSSDTFDMIMWPTPTWESDAHLRDRKKGMSASIPCTNGRVSIRMKKTESPPTLGLSVFPQWEITYTLQMDDISRSDTIGYVSTYEDATSLVRSYVDDIRSSRAENGQLDALDVKSQLDDRSPPDSEPMIVGTDDHRNRLEYN